MIKRYNGTAWNAVTYCKNFNGTEQFTYFPVVANTFANAISSWTIKGNEQHTGTPAPGNPIRGVGEETANLYNYAETVDVTDNKYLDQQGVERSSSSYQISYPITVEPETEYTWQFGGVNKHTAPTVGFYDSNDNLISAAQHINAATHFTFTTPSNCDYVRASVYKNSKSEAMLSKTSTAIPFEPYGYKIPISSGNATTPVYISAPLRKSLDGTVFDTLDSTGLVTYNVDEYGAPLVTPTTATVTVPTITSALGRTVISFGTSIQPSEFDMTYHGWHSHIPSIRSNNAWS